MDKPKNKEELIKLRDFLNELNSKYFGNPLSKNKMDKYLADLFKVKDYNTLMGLMKEKMIIDDSPYSLGKKSYIDKIKMNKYTKEFYRIQKEISDKRIIEGLKDVNFNVGKDSHYEWEERSISSVLNLGGMATGKTFHATFLIMGYLTRNVESTEVICVDPCKTLAEFRLFKGKDNFKFLTRKEEFFKEKLLKLIDSLHMEYFTRKNIKNHYKDKLTNYILFLEEFNKILYFLKDSDDHLIKLKEIINDGCDNGIIVIANSQSMNIDEEIAKIFNNLNVFKTSKEYSMKYLNHENAGYIDRHSFLHFRRYSGKFKTPAIYFSHVLEEELDNLTGVKTSSLTLSKDNFDFFEK